jgi:hypothetical protein
MGKELKGVKRGSKGSKSSRGSMVKKQSNLDAD